MALRTVPRFARTLLPLRRMAPAVRSFSDSHDDFKPQRKMPDLNDASEVQALIEEHVKVGPRHACDGVGADAASGQLSPGIWMNNCVNTTEHPLGVTAQGWTQASLRDFLDFLDSVGVRSIDMWTSNLSDNDLNTCAWFLPELRRWRAAAP